MKTLGAFAQSARIILLALVLAAASCSKTAPKEELPAATEEPTKEVHQVEQSAQQLPQTTPAPTEQGEVNKQLQSEAPVTGSVELIWQIPDQTVEKYHIEYGFAPDKLDRKVTVESAKLERVNDPVNGPIFRYVLHGIQEASSVYFTIQAENQFGVSPKSPVQEIK